MQYNRHFRDLFTCLKLYPKRFFRNCLHLRLTVWARSPKMIILALMCAIKYFLSRLVYIKSPVTHSNASRSGITSANVKIIMANVDPTLNVGTLLVDGHHFTINFSALFVLVAFFTTSFSFAFLASHSLWRCLECAVSRSASSTLPDRLLLGHLVLLSFTGSLALSVASSYVTSFTARTCEDLPSVSMV